MTTPITFPAGRVPTSSQMVAPDRISAALRISDSTPVQSLTTPANDTVLTLPVAANTVYKLDGRLIYTSGSVPDFKFGWTYPSGLTMAYGAFAIAVGTANFIVYQNVETDLPSVEGAGTGVARDVWLKGTVTVSSTPGDLIVRWAQVTSTASDTVLKAGSWFELTRWSP